MYWTKCRHDESTKICFIFSNEGHVLFFYVSRHFFFHQTYAGARKKNKMSKEKKTHWLSVPDHLTDK